MQLSRLQARLAHPDLSPELGHLSILMTDAITGLSFLVAHCAFFDLVGHRQFKSQRVITLAESYTFHCGVLLKASA
ncbi:hypothetical protein [Pseudomonas boanensis]|uniref:hypothetical protein n=1 Tax=Metapseudomonas boanensis TaxID=2822138 RepID=UPI0035D3ECF6